MVLCLQIKAISYFFKVASAKTPGPHPPRAKYGCPGLVFFRPGYWEAVPGVKIITPGEF